MDGAQKQTGGKCICLNKLPQYVATSRKSHQGPLLDADLIGAVIASLIRRTKNIE